MEFRARALTWNDIERWCSTVRQKIIKDYRPDLIIGLSRGGLVPARILSDSLWIKDLLSVKTEHWGITATRSGQAILKDPGSLNIGGRNVLIVDDITDTGQSMKLAHDFVKGQSPASIRTATMLHITRSEFIPDYYGEEITEKNWAWFIFPWNVYEDLDNLVSKILKREMNTAEIRRQLLESFDLDLDESRLESLLGEFAEAGRIRHVADKYYPLSNPVSQ